MVGDGQEADDATAAFSEVGSCRAAVLGHAPSCSCSGALDDGARQSPVACCGEVLLCSPVLPEVCSHYHFCCSGNLTSALQYWEEHAALSGSVLVFNTGRSLGQIQSLLTEKGKLAIPDALITAVGTKARCSCLDCSSPCSLHPPAVVKSWGVKTTGSGGME